MSLNFDYSKVDKAYVGADTDKELPVMLVNAIWNCLAIGIGRLTDKNIADAVSRTRILAGLDQDEARAQLARELPNYIGLSTNVSHETFSQWAKRMHDHTVKRVQWALEHPRPADDGETEDLTNELEAAYS